MKLISGAQAIVILLDVYLFEHHEMRSCTSMTRKASMSDNFSF